MKRYRRKPSPRERVARHLAAFDIEVHEDDIQQLHGSRSMKSDVIGGWEAHGKHGNIPITVSSPYTMTLCAKGIRLEKEPGRHCLYGILVAIPSSVPLAFPDLLWKPKPLKPE